MRKVDFLAVLVTGAAAIWGAGKVLGLAEAGITALLMAWRGYGYGAAAARAPLLLWAAVCVLAGLGLYGWCRWQENQQYKRAAKRQKMHPAQPQQNRKAG